MLSYPGDTWAYRCSFSGRWYACDARTALDAMNEGLAVMLLSFEDLIKRHDTLPRLA